MKKLRPAIVGPLLGACVLVVYGPGVSLPASAEAGGAACELPTLAAGGSGDQDTRDAGTGEGVTGPGGPVAAPSAPRGPARQDVELTVVGGPSESVVVIAPPGVKAIGIGGDGSPGTPGRSAQP